jgi:glycosyltransferase involved in cell wall biosynthesis
VKPAASIVRVVTRLNVGGPSRQAVGLTADLALRGYATHLVSGREAPGEGRIDLPPGLPIVDVPDLGREVAPLRDARAFRAIRDAIRERRPDVVHTHMAKAGALGRWAAHREGVPVVVHTFHGHVLDEYFARARERAFLEVERRLARRSDALVAVSEEIRDELLAMKIGEPDQWRVVPVGVDFSAFDGVVERAAARRTFGLSPDAPVIGCVGRLVPVKDHATLLEAFEGIVATHRDATLMIVGDGELGPELRERAAAFGDRVRFLGWRRDLPTVYAAIDVLALTSRNEGTPLAAIEAGAARRPVVATRVGGTSTVVLHDRTGYLVPAGDAAAVARSIRALLDDPDRRRRYGEAARTHVRSRFARERLTDDLDALYHELLARKLLVAGPVPAAR